MVRTHALMESVSANLQEFLQPIGVDLTKPQKKSLRERLLGLLRARRPVVTRIACKLSRTPGECCGTMPAAGQNRGRHGLPEGDRRPMSYCVPAITDFLPASPAQLPPQSKRGQPSSQPLGK